MIATGVIEAAGLGPDAGGGVVELGACYGDGFSPPATSTLPSGRSVAV
jgi:hypothetical protein